MVSRDFSALWAHSKFGHHPHPYRLPLCQISFLWRPPWRKNRVLNHAINQSPNHPAYFMPGNRSFRFGKGSVKTAVYRSYLRVRTSFYASLCRTDKLGTVQYSATADACTTAVSHWLNVTYMPRPHPSPRHLQMTFNSGSSLPRRSNALSFSAKKSTPNPSRKAHLLLIRENDV